MFGLKRFKHALQCIEPTYHFLIPAVTFRGKIVFRYKCANCGCHISKVDWNKLR